MSAKFTKGHWFVSSIGGEVYINSEDEGKLICDLTDSSSMDAFEKLANAKLIAAAPAMYEALDKFTNAAQVIDLYADGREELLTAYQEAIAAIQLATEGAQ